MVHQAVVCYTQVPVHFSCTPCVGRIHGTADHRVGTKHGVGATSQGGSLTLLCWPGLFHAEAKAPVAIPCEQLLMPGQEKEGAYHTLARVALCFVLM